MGQVDLKEGKLALKTRNLTPMCQGVQTWKKFSQSMENVQFFESGGGTSPAGSGESSSCALCAGAPGAS